MYTNCILFVVDRNFHYLSFLQNQNQAAVAVKATYNYCGKSLWILISDLHINYMSKCNVFILICVLLTVSLLYCNTNKTSNHTASDEQLFLSILHKKMHIVRAQLQKMCNYYLILTEHCVGPIKVLTTKICLHNLYYFTPLAAGRA